MPATEINSDSPLFIHSSDHPNLKLVSQAFDGKGYSGWKRSMLIALSAKNKLSFINGKNRKPASTDPTADAWQRCNDMVFCWILSALSVDVAKSILYSKSAEDAWLQLEELYGGSNGAQLYAIHKELSDFSQGNDSVTTYFARIKHVWDEFDAMRVNPECSCNCSCGAAAKRVKFYEKQRVMQFLMGLNDGYTVIRATILMMDPLPSLGSAYDILVQEEKQRELLSSVQFQTDSASLLYARNSKPFVKRNTDDADDKPPFCNYCKQTGHLIPTCERLKKKNGNKKFANLARVF